MPTDSGWWKAGRWVLDHHWLVSTACLLLMGVLAWGMWHAQTSVQLMRLLSPRERLLADYRWLESELGPLVPMEIVLHIDNVDDSLTTPLTFLDRMEMVARIQESVEEIDEVGATMSTVTFARDLELGGGGGGFGLSERTRRSVTNKAFLRHRADFLAGDYYREKIDEDGSRGEIWRISARVSALKNVDYDAFAAKLQDRVDPVLAEAAGKADFSVEYTGIMRLVYKAQGSLIHGLLVGFLMDFALVVTVMIVTVRSVAAGVVLLLPAAFPAVTVFGGMGWLHKLLTTQGWGDLFIDIGFVMAPCVALGVTVDDVVHYMLWFRRGIAEGMSRKQAVMLANKGCARAMYQSWGVIGIGLSIFSLSPFMPTRNFGIMMLAMLTAALIGNLLLMPALLAGPLGWVFAWGIRRRERRKAARGKKVAPHDSRGGEPAINGKPGDTRGEGGRLEPARAENGRPEHGPARDPVPEPHVRTESRPIVR